MGRFAVITGLKSGLPNSCADSSGPTGGEPPGGTEIEAPFQQTSLWEFLVHSRIFPGDKPSSFLLRRCLHHGFLDNNPPFFLMQPLGASLAQRTWAPEPSLLPKFRPKRKPEEVTSPRFYFAPSPLERNPDLILMLLISLKSVPLAAVDCDGSVPESCLHPLRKFWPSLVQDLFLKRMLRNPGHNRGLSLSEMLTAAGACVPPPAEEKWAGLKPLRPCMVVASSGHRLGLPRIVRRIVGPGR